MISSATCGKKLFENFKSLNLGSLFLPPHWLEYAVWGTVVLLEGTLVFEHFFLGKIFAIYIL